MEYITLDNKKKLRTALIADFWDRDVREGEHRRS
jgi:hypothetical protein